MELTLRSSKIDMYPFCGFFIEGASLSLWLEAIQILNINPGQVNIYALPAKTPNELWGCLVRIEQSLLNTDLGKYQSAHLIGNQLIVQEKTKVQPELIPTDFQNLFNKDTYVLHTDFGLYKLGEPIILKEHLENDNIEIHQTSRPVEHAPMNAVIRSFSIEATSKEELKKQIEDNKKSEKFKDKPLSIAEKLRLAFYKKIINSDDGPEGGGIGLNETGSLIDKLLKKLNYSDKDLNEKIAEDYRNLEERNKKEVDKLLDLLKNDPEKALRFAIPLDESGGTRGDRGGEFKLRDWGLNFSLFGGSGSGGSGGGVVDLGDEYFRLRNQYVETAQKLKELGQYEKAAYVYMKLLKDYHGAAQVLKEGKKYQKAALIYLDYLKDKKSAAECYEEGKIYEEAIKLYKDLDKFEKVGDLYSLLGNKKSADAFYQSQIDVDLEAKKILKASKISKYKMQNILYAQDLLYNGWKNKIDQYNCLRNYLKNIDLPQDVWTQIERIHKEDLTKSNETIFLKVLKDEYANKDENEKKVKKLAYEMISRLLESGKISSHELLVFNKQDKRFKTDIIRYNMQKNKRL